MLFMKEETPLRNKQLQLEPKICLFDNQNLITSDARSSKIVPHRRLGKNINNMDNKNPYPKMGEVEKKVVDKTKGMSTKEIAHFYKESADNEILQSGNTSVKFALPETKEEAFAASIIDEVQSGHKEGLKISIQCKFVIDALTELRESIKKEAMD